MQPWKITYAAAEKAHAASHALFPIIVSFQVETLLYSMFCISHKYLPTHWVLADECKAWTLFFQTYLPILRSLLHPLQSTTLPSAAPAGQLDVFTDHHLLFTTPQVVAPASSLSHRHESVRVECLIIHAALEVALVFLLSVYLSETAHILPRYPHTRGMESNNLMGQMNITWLKSIKTFTTCFIKITIHAGQEGAQHPLIMIQKVDMIWQHKDTEWRHVKHTVVWLIQITFTCIALELYL